MEAIYQRPRDYDLEHEGDDEDVGFYLKLLDRWRPKRVMELASGSGRVTIPLARLAVASGTEIRFLYDRFPQDQQVDRYVSDFDCHVYYPREVELLFRVAGFSIDCWFGDYTMRRLRATSRQLIGVGLKNT